MVRKITIALSATLLLVGIPGVQAADVIPEPYQPEVQQFSWTGFYVGAAGGWTFDGSADYQIPSAKDLGLDHELGGPLLGGQLGYNFQVGWLFAGAEIQGLWSGINGHKALYEGMLDTRTEIDWLAMGKLRGGVAFDRFAVFATGGYAGADVNPSAKAAAWCGDNENRVDCSSKWSDNAWANGYFYGLGAKVALGTNWDVGVEWNHIVLNDADFDSKVNGGPYDGMPLQANSDLNLDVLLATANFRF